MYFTVGMLLTLWFAPKAVLIIIKNVIVYSFKSTRYVMNCIL